MPTVFSTFIRAARCAELTGVCLRTWWRLVRRGKAPEPLRLSARMVRWRADEIAAWIAQGMPDQRRGRPHVPVTLSLRAGREAHRRAGPLARVRGAVANRRC